MSVLDICKMIISSPYAWIGATIVLSLIQISPLKLDPWTWIGNAFNKDVLQKIAAIEKQMDDRIDKVEQRIDKVEAGVDLANKKCDKYSAQREEDKVVNTRRRILRFNDELIDERPHTRESFKQILKDISYYKNYCSLHEGFCNDQANAAIRNINREYDVHCKNHSFAASEEDDDYTEGEIGL